tara:strand:- start:6988 stop:7254 length:267 start_codon:yes stop_codon:yes gene_type:complete
MQKIVNGIAILSGVVSLTVVGAGGYLYLNKDSLIEKVKTQAIEAVMSNLGGIGGAAGLGGDLPIGTPDLVPSTPQANVPAGGLGISQF